MIKFEIDKEHRIQQLECAGSPVELAAEIGLMIQAIYAETSSINPIAGGMLKRLFQAGMTDDSPAWRGTGEFAAKYFTKGQMAAVEGRLQVRDWTDKDGAKRRSHEVIVDSLYFAGSKRQSEAQAEPGDFREIPEDEEGELPF